MKGTFPIHKFRELRTPFYYYDTKVLRDTLSCIRTEAARYGNYSVHYAVKANANPKVLAIIRENGLGADCVSGGEIRAAIKAGDHTSPQELMALAEKILSGEVPPFCPHGRPCVLKLTRKELEKQFGRIV